MHSKITSLYALGGLNLFSKDNMGLELSFNYEFKGRLPLNLIRKIQYIGHSCIASLDIICSTYFYLHVFKFLMISFSFLFATSFRCGFFFFSNQGSWIINTAINFFSSENYKLDIRLRVTVIALGSWRYSSALVLCKDDKLSYKILLCNFSFAYI